MPGASEIRPHVLALQELLFREKNEGLHEATAMLWRLLAVLGRAKAVPADPLSQDRAQPGGGQRLAVARTKKYIERHLGDAIQLGTLAKAACLSPFHFARIFREATGFAPAAYVRALRISKAKELLQLGEKNVTEVARAVGFPRSEHFSAVLKKQTGRSPRAFVQSFRTISKK